MISTQVNAEISDYHEKFFLGLSIRQLICVAIALVISMGIGAVAVLGLHISLDYLGYVIVLLDMPFFAVGFIKIKGMKFEVYARLWVQWNFETQQFSHKLGAKNTDVSLKKEKGHGNGHKCECSPQWGKPASRREAKAIAAQAAAAEKELQQYAENTESPEKCRGLYPI